MNPFLYRSTRKEDLAVTFSEAVVRGLAPDGGLYIPHKLPTINMLSLSGLTYQERALAIMHPFMPEIPKETLMDALLKAYDGKFEHGAIAPIQSLDEGTHVLELFHGRTLAFKDMALSLLPYLIKIATKAQGKNQEVVILTATSGDTGKAALEAFSGVEGTKIIVFYPTDGVSEIQKRAMATQTGDNVHVFGIRGNFDDAQAGVKSVLNDSSLIDAMVARGQQFSSANSMNIGRLLPQIVYYVHSYHQLVERGAITLGAPLHVCVPTGNFGNILAAFYARDMGLPIDKLICASNSNHVLTDFFQTGHYNTKRPFYVTPSPSMDILVSSNLERLLYQVVGPDSLKILMQDLAQKGEFTLNAQERMALEQTANIHSGTATDSETLSTIAHHHQVHHYVADPHTAVALKVLGDYRASTGDQTPCLVAATASPFKFSTPVLGALSDAPIKDSMDEVARLQVLSQKMGLPIPQAVQEILDAPILHKGIIEIEEISHVIGQVIAQ